MRADSLRASAAQYRLLSRVYPAAGYEETATRCESEAVLLEAEWAEEDARWAVEEMSQ